MSGGQKGAVNPEWQMNVGAITPWVIEYDRDSNCQGAGKRQ